MIVFCVLLLDVTAVVRTDHQISLNIMGDLIYLVTNIENYIIVTELKVLVVIFPDILEHI